jgi:hypothetical protein
MDKKKCKICGKFFGRLNKHDVADRDWFKKTTCSISCRGKWVALLRRAKWVAKKCLCCGKDIMKRDSRFKYCDSKCMVKHRIGVNSQNWKGGKKKHGEYIQIHVSKKHPFADFHGYIMEHRFVIEEWYRKNKPDDRCLVEVDGKKYLNPIYKVHHKNDVKDDNRIQNLVPVASQSEHFHFNFCPLCPHCIKSGELLENPEKDNQQPSI